MKLRLLFQGGKVSGAIVRVGALKREGNVVSLIHLLDSDVRGATRASIVRSHAAKALGELGDPRAIPYLIEKRDDPEDTVRMFVIQALGRLGGKHEESVVSEGLTDRAAIVRWAAAEALGRMGAVDAIPLLRNALDTDPDPAVRVSAVESLLILGDESARDRVPEALSAISWRVRRHPQRKRLQRVAESGETLTPWDWQE